MARSKNKQKRQRLEFKKKRDRKAQRKKALKSVSAGMKKKPSAK